MRLAWKDLTTLLDGMVATLGHMPAPCADSMLGEWIATLTFAEIAEVDTLLRSMLAARFWPAMNQKQQAQIHLRLAMALELCAAGSKGAFAAMRDSTGRPPWKDEHEALTALLIEFWWNSGVSWAVGKSPG